MAMEWIQFICGTLFLVIGIVIFLLEVFGIFHLKYVLNRMHVAAMGDTLALSSSLLGILIFTGFNMASVKIALIIVFFWFSSPVASHVLARLEVVTNENLEAHCEVYKSLSDLEKELEESEGKEE